MPYGVGASVSVLPPSRTLQMSRLESQSVDCIGPNHRNTFHGELEQIMERSGWGTVEVLSRYLSGRTGGGDLSKDSLSPCLNSNREPQEYKLALVLHILVRRETFLKMEVIYSFETSFNFHRATWRYVPKDITLYIREIQEMIFE
jgi:hypothetical protein